MQKQNLPVRKKAANESEWTLRVGDAEFVEPFAMRTSSICQRLVTPEP
jgi:hypothetical protein